ncbi:hypothetical protein P7C65_06s1g09350 [Encephalitozoon intestinalis]
MESKRKNTTKELLRKIESQIDKVAFLHSNPTQAREIGKALPPLHHPQEILGRCIARMDRLNSMMNPMKCFTTSIPSIEKQVEYLHQRKKEFDEDKCYSLLTKNRVDGILSNRKATIRTKGRTLSYEFKEKLTGFLSKRGNASWSNEKIDDFINSMMK